MHPPADCERVTTLIREGLNDCEISRRTGIHRRTVCGWRHNGPPGRRGAGTARGGCQVCGQAPLDGEQYAYLLGTYLGDGCLAKVRRTWCLRVVQDQRYRALIERCAAAMAAVSARRVSFARKTGCVVATCYWNHWPCLFPQHGPGRKHERLIALDSWQRRIVAAHPERLLEGLIHSDGCRVLNRVNGKDYPRYQFVNHSADIHRIFTDACDLLGIGWTRPKWQVVSIARARDVARLDAVIARKA
jgi:hypothetical protein